MLCRLCSSIDFEAAAIQDPPSQSRCKHCKSVIDLEISANNGCQLCQVLFQYGAPQAAHSRGMAQDVEGDELIDLDQIYYATSSNSPSHYPHLPVHGVTEIQFFRQGERSGARKDRFFVSLELFAQPGNHQIVVQSGTEANLSDSLAAKSGYILGRPIVEKSDSEACYEQIHRWMLDCAINHNAACPMLQASSLLPTRVIDVNPSQERERPRILETFRQHGDLVALSHCWGTKTRYVLDSTTRTELLEGMAMENLPPAFRDAIRVTKGLGYRYLWIDSLCILQDSVEDWDHESGRMQEYYTNAILTIALDDTEGDHLGFLDRLRLSDKAAVAVPFHGSEPNIEGGSSASHPNREVVHLSYERSQVAHNRTGGFLGRRGWTLQEDILSMRTVHYENGRLRWECQEFLGFEGLPHDSSTPCHMKYNFLGSIGSLITQGYHPTWYNIVETYMKRELTFVEDKFPAISGIAKAVAKRVGFEYIAGIWLEDIHFGLSWFIEGKSERERTYVAPSWSWASIKTPIDGTIQGTRAYHARNDHGGHYPVNDGRFPMALELIDYEVVSRGKDPFGQLTHAIIVLRGLLLEFSKWRAGGSIHIGTSFLPDTDSSPCTIDCNFDEPSIIRHCGPSEDTRVDPGARILEDLYLFHIYSPDHYRPGSWLLILMPTTTEGEFQRVGLARAETDEVKAAGGWDFREVTIV